MSKLEINKDYKKWLLELKLKIKNSQIKAALQVNSELIALYWNIGAMICEKQSKSNWGSKLIEQIATDLKAEFPDLTGFSRSNLYSMRQFQKNDIVQKLKLIPWGHHTLILQKIKKINELVKDETDKPTIGILLCKNKDNFVVDFSIKDINKPIGVSKFSYNELPEDIKSELPSEKQLKEELKKIECE